MTKYIKKENLFEVLKQFESGQQSLALEKMGEQSIFRANFFQGPIFFKNQIVSRAKI